MSGLQDLASAWVKELRDDGFGLDLPVDVASIADELGIRYRERLLPIEVDGLYYRCSNGAPYIIINNYPTKPLGRRRFSAAHELCHHLLSQSISISHSFLDADCTHHNELERACNRFAAELLMPTDTIREWFHDLRGNPDYRDQIIAERCGVTVMAVRVRMEELGLAKKFRAGKRYR